MRANLEWLENPEVFQVNRLAAHSDHHFYETEEDMNVSRETLRQSLNGIWKMMWSKKPADRPEDFYQADTDISMFQDVVVPGHVELQGYDQIHYINTMYPWDGHTFLRPPHIDWEYDPVSSYVKEFDLEEGLKGKRVCISFQGAEQAIYVWLNGSFVGYAEDTFTPSDFDLTPFIKETGNRLCVEVYKRSSAAWIEDQDFFRFSGLFRDVFLYAKPALHVEDMWAKAGLTEDYTDGTFELSVKLSGEADAQVSWSIEDEKGEMAAEGTLKELEAGLWGMEEIILPQVEKWDLGMPNLYRLVIRVADENGELIEVVPYKIGFRRFEMKNKIMHLNGKRLIINGVNRHEWCPEKGRAVNAEDMIADLEVMKKNNINAVRTCHYPNQSLWYQLCDEAGICVMDETNLESHGSWQKMGACEPSWTVPGSNPEWEGCVVDRATSMLERDKNHPSILWWSCGNESYAGTALLAMSNYFRETDPSRLVHYEGVFWNRDFNEISDVESRMYAKPEEIREYLEKDPQKPFLLCEYMHDMGNSIGGMESYIQLLEDYEMYQGGFIWDFKDQAVYYTNKYGKKVLGYGGDFDDRTTDYAFSGNGIVFADRTEKPAMQDVKFWHMTPEERKLHEQNNEEKYLETKVKLEAMVNDVSRETLRVVHGDLNLGIHGENFHIIFSHGEAGPVSIVYGGKECLYRAPRPAFWRATTENDKGNGFPMRSAVWMTADAYSPCIKREVEEHIGDRVEVLNVDDMVGRKPASEGIDSVTLRYTFLTQTIPQTTAVLEYTVDGSGKIAVKATYKGQEGLPELPEFGVRFILPKKVESFTWEGLSGETYPDRYKGAEFGVHTGTTEVPDYLVPQECGNHMDTCQAVVGNLRFVMKDKPFHFSALGNTPLELESAMHKEELPEIDRTVVSILGAMRGVGGIDSWGADVEKEYHILADKDIEFEFYIMPAM